MSDESQPVSVLEESHQLPIVDFWFVSRTGTAHDPPGREGALSLALRSLRRGAGDRKAFAIDDEIDRLGAELSVGADVSTTTVHASVIRRNLEPFLDLLADLLLRPTFPPSEVAQVVRETRADIIDSRNDDRTLAARAFRRHLFAGHPFGRPANGTLITLDNLSSDEARAQYERAFTRTNLVVGAAGELSADELRAMIDHKLAPLRTNAAPPRTLPEPSRPRGRRLVIVDKPDRTQTQIYIGALGTHTRDRDHTALQVANTVFGGTFTARLMREVRSKRGWSYGASSRLGRDRVRESWAMWTFPAARDAAECIALELRLLEELIENGVTERELSFAKSYLIKSYAFETDTAAKRLGQRLDEIVMELPKGYYRDYVERVRAVTLDEANAAIRKRLTSKDLLITIVATAKDLRPALERAIPALLETRVVPFDQDEIVTA